MWWSFGLLIVPGAETSGSRTGGTTQCSRHAAGRDETSRAGSVPIEASPHPSQESHGCAAASPGAAHGGPRNAARAAPTAGAVLSVPRPNVRPVPELTDDELALLDFEDQWWRHPAAKENSIRGQFGLAPTRYYQRLNTLVNRPEAEAARPVVVRRLQRLRATRTRG
ncbi:DUF3263 domain-containing protein [Modestobacter lapidis]|nr:DUF3263 domain-containing protein [Modestobacter lapidis]